MGLLWLECGGEGGGESGSADAALPNAEPREGEFRRASEDVSGVDGGLAGSGREVELSFELMALA